MTDRIALSSGTTINDVYAAFCEVAYGNDEPGRSRDELRDVIQAAHVRYEDCGALTVSTAWAYGESDVATEFVATHKITIVRRGEVETVLVHVVDGCAYTQQEWDADASADWQFGEDGALLLLGQVPICDEYSYRSL